MEELLSRAGLFAILAVAVSLVRYGLYLTSIFKGETRPHLFSWTNWGLIVGIGDFQLMFWLLSRQRACLSRFYPYFTAKRR